MALFFQEFNRVYHHGGFNIQDYQLGDSSSFRENTDYTVVWYKEIHNGYNSSNTVKSVEVVFVNQKNGFEVKRKTPLVATSFFPIGSIWRNGESSEKYKFDSFSVCMKGDSSNVEYSRNSKTKKENTYINGDNYPVYGIGYETNTMLVVSQYGVNYIIHPLIFFNALYGASKYINRVLLTYLWDDIVEKLELNTFDEGNPEAVIIPKQGVIADAVFLHYLKYNENTERIVKALVNRVRVEFASARNSAPLKVEPYHDQDIDMVFNGYKLDEKNILCTEITAISMPRGEPIEFILGKDVGDRVSSEGCMTHSFKPLVHSIETEEILLEGDSTPNNETTAVIRHRISNINNIRELIRVKGASELDALDTTNTVITLDKPFPTRFADGERVGFDGDIGLIQVLNESGANLKTEKNNFEKLLGFAKDLKSDPTYYPLIVDCYTKDGFAGECAIGCKSQQHRDSIVSSVFVLRLKTSRGTYILFDCDLKGSQQTSGIAIKLKTAVLEKESYDKEVKMVIRQLFESKGRLPDTSVIRKKFGEVKLFKHINSDNSNWVKTALDKF